MKYQPDHFKRVGAGSAALIGLLASLSGCRSSGPSEASIQAGQQAAEANAKQARAQADDITSATAGAGGFSGMDAKGHKLWSVEARRTRIFRDASKGAGSLEDFAPRKAQLLDAKAQLFRSGQLESKLAAPILNYEQQKTGDHFTLLNAPNAPQGALQVTATSSGALRPDVGPVVLKAPQVDVTPRTRVLVAPKGAKAYSSLRKATLSGDRVEGNTDLGTMRARGNVRAQSPQGSARSDFAVWNWKADRAGATGHVSATNGEATLKGNTLNANLDTSRGEMTGGVTAQSKDGGTARAPRMTFDWGQNRMQGTGGVTLQKDGGTLQAPQVSTDTKFSAASATGGVTLQKDGGTLRAATVQAFDKLTRATANGDVRLEKDGATMRAPRVEAFEKMTRAVATGGVTMTREGATLRANRVEAFDKFESARATGSVRLTRADMTVTANSATATNLRDETKIQVQATGGVHAQSAKGSLRAARVVWSGGGKNGQIQGTGGVTIARPDGTISAPRGTAQLKNSEIASAVMQGGVTGTLPKGGTFQAPSATYTAAGGGQLKATGGVTARQNGSTLRANTLDVTQGGNFVDLDGNIVVTTQDGVVIRAPHARYNKLNDTLVSTQGVVFDDKVRGLHQTARAMTVYNFSNAQKRRTVFDHVQGGGRDDVLKGLKL